VDAVHSSLTLPLALAVGILIQSLSRHLRLPGIVLLLVAGAALGPDGLGWIEPRALGEGLFTIVDLAVAVILFEGGLNLEISRLRREQASIRRLVILGALVTLLGGALAVRALFDWPWMIALLFGSLVVVTGPTVVGPLVRSLRLRTRVSTVLEAEGVLIDPIGAILAVLLLEVALAPGADSFASQAQVLVERLGFGVAAGALAGFALGGILRVRDVVPEGLENVFTLAAVLLLFEGCDAFISHTGILAVTTAGVVVGNLRTRVDRDLREFKDQLTVLLIGLLFVLLAADVRLADVQALGWPGVAVVGALVFAIRPVNVWLCSVGTDLTGPERWFIAWVAPRGIVAAAVASIAARELGAAGIAGGPELRALVFLTIAVTVLLAGLTAAPVANLLRVRLPGRNTVAILGAHGLGLHLADELQSAGIAVVFLDANPHNCRRAEEGGHSVVFGDAMQERTMLRTRPHSVAQVIGLTPNQTLNSVFVSRARSLFGVPEGYVAVERPRSGLAPELVENRDARMLFEGPHDVERWDVRSRHDEISLEHWRFAGAEEAEGAEDAEPKDVPSVGERFVILAVRRGLRCEPMHTRFKLKPGDVASVAVHEGDSDEAHAILRKLGFEQEADSEPALSE
jgi:NhaP-type Na+/H+ or K+/H+ antiporter/Trk K+ transport system NAD-binding subunit